MVFCGIDIGTTNIKGVLIDAEGKLVDRVSMRARSAQNDIKTSCWYKRFCDILDHFSSKGHFSDTSITCSITAQGGSFILLDEEFSPVSRAYSWTENADDTTVQDLINVFGVESYYQKTGWEPNSWLMACKLKNLLSKKQMSENAIYIATVPDFIYSQITGKFITDITNAQITGLCDFRNSGWDKNILSWVGIDDSFLPQISNSLSILCENVKTQWGTINFVTSSHDQYAAMQAAGLVPEENVMLGTGTAWVINSRSCEPLFDNNGYQTHPGRDIVNDYYGNIIGLGPVGADFDLLLERLSVTKSQLAKFQIDFDNNDLVDHPIRLEDESLVNEVDCKKLIKNYMLYYAASATFILERFGFLKKLDKIIMSGGATGSHFWPKIIADLCGKTVEAFNFSEFTAYGAALHAMSAFGGSQTDPVPLQLIDSKCYEHDVESRYHHWYTHLQKPMLEGFLDKQK